MTADEIQKMAEGHRQRMAEIGLGTVLTRAGGTVRPLRRPGPPPSAATGNPAPRSASRQRAAVLTEAIDRLQRGVAMMADVKRRQRSRFPSLAENLKAVRAAAGTMPKDGRLQRAPTGSYEGDAAAGGFLIQNDFAAGLIGSMYGENGSVLASLANLVVVDGGIGSRKYPGIDELSRADGSRWGGVTSYWSTEADEVAPSFPRFRNIEFSPKKIIAAIKATNELMADAPLFENFVTRAFASEVGFKLDAAVLAGSGAGQPLGILNSGATIVVDKESGQSAATIVRANIEKMWSRLPLTSRRNAIWLTCEDAALELAQLNSDGETTAFQFIPAGVAGNSLPLLAGRPVLTIEQASPLGTVGDIVLADMSQYLILQFPLQTALSVHASFLDDSTIFRFVLRVDGASAYTSPITPYNGTATRSPFVTLAARS